MWFTSSSLYYKYVSTKYHKYLRRGSHDESLVVTAFFETTWPVSVRCFLLQFMHIVAQTYFLGVNCRLYAQARPRTHVLYSGALTSSNSPVQPTCARTLVSSSADQNSVRYDPVDPDNESL